MNTVTGFIERECVPNRDATIIDFVGTIIV